MFGLSIKETLFKAIVNACHNYKSTYKQAIIENIDKLNCCNENEADAIIAAVRRDYLDAVSNAVINTFQVSSPSVFSRIQLALMCPSVCGYDEINIENGIGAGSLFAICFYAIKNSTAKPRECIQLNHIQHDIMNAVLTEIDSEL